MSKIICRICLRTDLQTRDIDEALVDFHDEITEYAIYENQALKYCSECEHLLLKFYMFTQKCRKAHQILKNLKRERKGVFPSNLHELLLQSLSGCNSPTIFKFNVNNDNVEPLTEDLVIKQENPEDVLGNDYYSQQANMKNITLAELADIDMGNEADMDLEDEVKLEENDNPLSLSKVQSTFEKTLKSDEQITIKIEVKQKDYSSDVQDDYLSDLQGDHNGDLQDDHSEDSSDTELINEFKNRIEAAQHYKQRKTMRKKGLPIITPRPKQPLRNVKELEKIFEIHLFPTEKDAKDELELRKTIEPYLSAEYKCQICYLVFKYSKKLEFHMRWHDPSAGEFECDVCKMRFRSKKAAVTNHKNYAHYGKFKCKKCPLVTYNKKVMIAHYLCHAGVKFTCKLCFRTFNHTSTYKTHMRTNHTTDHVCVTCARTFVSQKGLIAHRNLKHNTYSYVDEDATALCAPCGLTFANEQVYTLHIMNTEKHKDLAKSIIACKECGARFGDQEHLRDHKRSQHNTLKNKFWIKKNRNTDNSNKTNNYECSICGVEGSSNLWVLKHVASAHPESPYAADLAMRRRHMCETCGKRYTTIYALRDHINTHSGTKPFACEKCPARFSSRPNLTLHEEFHAPAKRQCKHCGKKFVSASNLSNHMRSHIQDRRYKCSLCHKGFLYPASLREHVRGVHHNVRRVRKLVKREPAACDP